MTKLGLLLWNEEAGFVVTAELILIATIAVLAMVVGLTEVAFGINQELEDTASAFGAVNQSFRFSESESSHCPNFFDYIDFVRASFN